MHKFCDEFGRQGGEFAGFENHGTSGQKCRCQFRNYLVERPVPRRDQNADANGLAHQIAIVATARTKRVVFRGFQSCFDMARATFGLGVVGPVPGRAHLGADGLGHFGIAPLKRCLQFVQHLGAVGHGGLAVALEGFFGSGHRALGVVGAAHEHFAHNRLITGADNGVNGVRTQRFDPSAIDVKVATCHSVFSCFELKINPYGTKRTWFAYTTAGCPCVCLWSSRFVYSPQRAASCRHRQNS